ncbi:unnamed protein product [Wuchereria bancrofti]|uniref:Uncharacterized protein n=2 Tax=Wuchereria bancrofti TaxID=6293 RepID=A0A3P7EFS1_WUCBA|nr:unnamed protein product [Wuchereria bancrofti]
MTQLDNSMDNDHSINADNSRALLRSRRIKRQELPCFACPNVQFIMDVYCAHFKYLFTVARIAGRKKRSVENACPCCRCCGRKRRSILRNDRSQLQHFNYEAAKK